MADLVCRRPGGQESWDASGRQPVFNETQLNAATQNPSEAFGVSYPYSKRTDGPSDDSWRNYGLPGLDQTSSTVSSCSSLATDPAECQHNERCAVLLRHGTDPGTPYTAYNVIEAEESTSEAFPSNNAHQEMGFSITAEKHRFHGKDNPSQAVDQQSAEAESWSSGEDSDSEEDSDDEDYAEMQWAVRRFLQNGNPDTQFLEKFIMQKLALIDMRKLLPTTPSVTSCACTDNSRTASGSGGIMRSSQGLTGGVSTSRTSFSENGNGQGGADGDKDGKDSQKPHEDPKEPASASNSPKFACPFYKRDPSRYQNTRGCPGPGWPTVHRLKSHLYNTHMRPIQCSRCWDIFPGRGDLERHVRAEPSSCEIKPENRADGIDEQQKDAIRSKKRSRNIQNEVDRWKHVYRIIFPHDVDVPSPYYNPSEATRSSPDSDEFANYEAYRRAEMESRLTARLQSLSQDDGFSPIRENLNYQVMEFVRDISDEILQEYNQRRAVGTRSSAQDLTQSTASNHDGDAVSTMSNDTQHYSPDNQLGPMFTAPPPLTDYTEASHALDHGLMETQPVDTGSSHDSRSGPQTESSIAARAQTISTNMTEYPAFSSRGGVHPSFQAQRTVDQRQWPLDTTFMQDHQITGFSFNNNQMDSQAAQSQYPLLPQPDMLAGDLFESQLREGQAYLPPLDGSTMASLWSNPSFAPGPPGDNFPETNETEFVRPRKRRH